MKKRSGRNKNLQKQWQIFSKFDKNDKLTDPRNSYVFKQKKCKEKHTKTHIITKLSKSNNKDENLKRTIGEKDIYRTIKKNDNRFSSKILLTKTQGEKNLWSVHIHPQLAKICFKKLNKIKILFKPVETQRIHHQEE